MIAHGASINDCIQEARQQLADCSDSPHLDACLLLAAACGVERSMIVAHPERLLNATEQHTWLQYLQRRIEGEPVAYIVGGQWFWEDYFLVNHHVLVPRADTECLIAQVLAMTDAQSDVQVCEIGTGSGCIILSLAKARPHWRCTASDISADALCVAASNAEHLLPGRVTFCQSDLMASLPAQQWDWIISNPPYIAGDDPCLRSPGVRAEPRLALVAEAQGMAVINRLVDEAVPRLADGGYLLIEHGATQAHLVRAQMQQQGLHAITTIQDDGGRDRATMGCCSC